MAKPKKSEPAGIDDTPVETPQQRAKVEPPPYRCLGYIGGVYYYYSRGEQAVVALNASAHGKKNFYRLAPHLFWVANYQSKENDFDENKAASSVMSACQAAGIFNVNRIRGRGVWHDGKDMVIHYGDKVTIKNTDYKPFLTPGKYVYELGEALGFAACTPLSDADSEKFPDLIKRLRWESEDQALWLCGWIVCALIGGALPWRPHIWLTGGAQSGKTTLSGVIKAILRNNCLYIKSVSTEAGIRQTLKADCLSVVMDEAEREDASSHSRIQSVLTLARQASSDDDSKIVKGTPTGNALNYQIRSPFCLSSINSALIQTADKTRFTNIELSSNKLSGEVYRSWKEDRNSLLSEEYVQRFYQRIFCNVETIVHNAKMLADAIEAKTGDRRLGDQYGALLAGARILYGTTKFTAEDAKWNIETIEFNSEKENASGINDQHSLLNKIMQHVMRVPKDKGYEDLSIAEMCQRIIDGRDYTDDCKLILGSTGIRVVKDTIAIANDNDKLADILSGSRWPANWHQTLKRLTFATSSAKPIYFSPGCKPRAVILPVENVLFKDD